MKTSGGARLETVAFLLEQGANPSLINNSGQTALHQAAETGQSRAVIDLLLRHGADISARNDAGKTALEIATNDATRQALADATLNYADADGRTALHVAVLSQPGRVSELLESGVNPNVRDKNGNTALLLGILERRISAQTADLLLSEGASFLLINQAGDWPLTAAASLGMLDIVRLLVKMGARADAKSRDGFTALQSAAWRASRAPQPNADDADADYAGVTAELLRADGVDLDSPAPDGLTPVHHAALAGNRELLEMFADAGADLAVPADDPSQYRGRVSSDMAAQNGHYALLGWLVEQGAELTNGLAYAREALSRNDAELLGALLENGVEGRGDFYSPQTASEKVGAVLGEFGVLDLPVSRDNDGSEFYPWLHHAVGDGDDAAVARLLEFAADPNVEDDEGRMPLDIALNGDDEEIAVLLLDGGAVAGRISPEDFLTLISSFGEDILLALSKGGAEADLALANDAGEAALHIAARRGHARLLAEMASGAEESALNAQDAAGMTPSDHARASGNADTVAVAKTWKDDPDEIMDDEGNTRLHLAARNGDAGEVYRWIKAGADPNIMNKKGFHPLHDTAYWLHPSAGHAEAARALLEGGADINALSARNSAAGAYEEPALHHAARQGQAILVEVHLEFDADPFIRGRAGNAFDAVRRSGIYFENGQRTLDLLEAHATKLGREIP